MGGQEARSSRPTDHDRRDLAALHLAVVRGESKGQILWQPRIGCWITDKRFAGEPLPEPFEGMSRADMFRELKCSCRLYNPFNQCFRKVEDDRVRFERTTDASGRVITTIHTPAGKQTVIQARTRSSDRPVHVKREIASEEEMRAAIWRAEHADWEFDRAQYDQFLEEWGDLGAPTMYMPRVNVQDLYINTMGVEAATYALADYPDTVEAYFRALDELHDRLIDVINESPVEIINFGDNVHAGTLSPKLFERYVLPAYQHRCERLHKAGKFVHAHWDGDVGPLLPYARETGLDGVEAVTPAPQGDVTLEQVKDAFGDELFLIDGIPAIYFDETFPVSVLEECARRLIDLFAPKLILGISDEISSTGDIERIRAVGRIVDDYNASQAAAG